MRASRLVVVAVAVVGCVAGASVPAQAGCMGRLGGQAFPKALVSV